MKKQTAYIVVFVIALLGFLPKASAQTSALYVAPIESTALSPVWYFIQSGDGNVLELPATGTTINVVASPLTANSDGMFWRFEKNGDGTYKIINKARSGSVFGDLSWNETSTLTVNINAVSGAVNRWSISNGANYFSAAVATGVSATTTTPVSTENKSQFAFVKAPIAGTDNNNTFYQLKSGRTASATILYLSGTSVAWYSTDNTTLPVQMFQFRRGDAGYFTMKIASAVSSNITVGTLSTAPNVTIGSATATQFFFNPRLDGYVVINMKGELSTVTFDYNGSGTCGIYTGRTFAALNSGFRATETNYDISNVLTLAINAAESTYSISPVGTNPGTYPTGTKATYRSAIDAAISLNNNPATTSQQKTDATAVLNQAKADFLLTRNAIKLSTAGNDVWYYFTVACSTYGTGQVLVNQNSTAGTPILFATKSVDPNKLWRFVDAGNGKVAIQNRASNLYITAAPTTSVGTTTTSTAFNVGFLNQDAQFTFNADGQQPLHAQQAGSVLVTWNAWTANSGSSWKLDELPAGESNAPVAISSFAFNNGLINTGIGNTNHPLAYAAIGVGGLTGSVSLKSINIDFTGTTNIAAVKSVKLYSTGSDIRLKSTVHTLLGQVDNPSSATSSITIPLETPLALPLGTTNLYLAVDVADNANEGDIIDSRILSLQCSNGTDFVYTPTTKTNTYSTTVFLTQSVLFSPGDAGSKYYRIPAIVTAPDGSLITATDKRNNNEGDLPNDIDILIRRSTDNGKTWSVANMIAGNATTTGFGDAALVVDKITQKIFCTFVSDKGLWNSTASAPIKTIICESSDNGLTWSTPKDITGMLYGSNCTDPVRKIWLGGFIASGRGLQLQRGSHAGRLMFAIAMRDGSALNNYVVYSDDHGVTWTINNTAANATGGDEAKFAERNNGSVVISIRNGGTRKWNVSANGGDTWGTVTNNSYLQDPACNGEIMNYTSTLDGYDKNRMLHSLCYASNRTNVSMLYSVDEGATFTKRKTICAAASAYSTFTILPDGTIGMYYEDGTLGGGYDMNYVRFSLNWLTSGTDTYTNPSLAVDQKQASAIRILVEGGKIIVQGSDKTARVYNTTGLEMNINKRLPKGVYIVKVANENFKTLVD